MSQEPKTSPPSFRDAANRLWTLRPTLGQFDAIQDATGVDLLADGAGGASPVMALIFDRRKLSDVLWAACKPQADSQEITRASFRDALDGETLSGGWAALIDAVVFFTPSHSRAALRAQLDAELAASEQGLLAIAEVAASQETDKEIRKAIGKLKDEMQASLPAALESVAKN
jgi:hypothetical protein